MIELFSRRADAIALSDDAVLTPLPLDHEISSLSAILLDDAYYQFLREGKTTIDGIPILDAMHLIPFKAKAWLDLRQRKEAGAKAVSYTHLDVYKRQSQYGALTKTQVIRLLRDKNPETAEKILRNLKREHQISDVAGGYYLALDGLCKPDQRTILAVWVLLRFIDYRCV